MRFFLLFCLYFFLRIYAYTIHNKNEVNTRWSFFWFHVKLTENLHLTAKNDFIQFKFLSDVSLVKECEFIQQKKTKNSEANLVVSEFFYMHVNSFIHEKYKIQHLPFLMCMLACMHPCIFKANVLKLWSSCNIDSIDFHNSMCTLDTTIFVLKIFKMDKWCPYKVFTQKKN